MKKEFLMVRKDTHPNPDLQHQCSLKPAVVGATPPVEGMMPPFQFSLNHTENRYSPLPAAHSLPS